jgi:hypothetical protein
MEEKHATATDGAPTAAMVVLSINGATVRTS